MNITGKNVFKNFVWRFLERCGAQGIALIVSIVLARVLGPSVYGVVAIVTIFTNILQVFIDSGLGNALIQKKNADEIDFSTVFWFNLVLCLCLYIVLFISSEYIAIFYDLPELRNIIRVMGLTIPISGIKNIQQAFIAKNMIFKKFFWGTIIGTTISAAIGIYLAFNGAGVWALVAQNITNQVVDTIILWIIVGWRPIFSFSTQRLKTLIAYGGMLLLADFVDSIFVQIRQLIVGKKYSSDDLAFYNTGDRYPRVLVSNINSAIDSVLLPAMAKVQDDRVRVGEMTRRVVKTSIYCLMPLMVGFAVCAPTIVKILLTDIWLPCVPYIRIFCVVYIFYPLHTANLNAIKAIGRTDLYLRIEILKKIVGITILIVSIQFGSLAIAIGVLFESFIALTINIRASSLVIDYGLIEQIKDILSTLLLSLFMGGVVYCISFVLGQRPFLCISIQCLIGIVVYCLMSYVFKLDNFLYIRSMLRR